MADDFARQLLDALYNPESPQQPAQPQQPQQRRIAQLYDPERLRRLGGIGEAALTIGTGYASGIPAGLAGLAQMIPTRGRVPDVNKAAQTVEDIQGALTYLPRGETGQRVLQKVAKPLEMLGAPAEYLAEKTFEKTGSPLAATFVGTAGDPMNLVGLPGSGRAIAATTRAAGRAAAAAPRVAGEMASDLLMGRGRMEGQRGAIKMKGGNWLAGEVEGAIEPLRPRGPTHRDEALILGGEWPAFVETPQGKSVMAQNDALNNWIDKKLNRYIRNEMATPEDPVRKLADQGISHIALDSAPYGTAVLRRGEAGFPKEGYATTPEGQVWEAKTDASILFDKAGEMGDPSMWGSPQAFQSYIERNPWVAKAAKEAPETPIYEMAGRTHTLGFSHLIDELKNSIRPDSDLPAHLRWKPEDLEKVTMEQAVRRVHDINQYRAQKKAEANDVLARNPATVTFKEYPTIPGTDLPNERGLAWKEIKEPSEMPLPEGWSLNHKKENDLYELINPNGQVVNSDYGAEGLALPKAVFGKKALEDALKYEGDVMGHCVGGYCDDVLSGRSKIYSLRDNKGEPLVTIEVVTEEPSQTALLRQPKEVQDEFNRRFDKWLENLDYRPGQGDIFAATDSIWRSMGIPLDMSIKQIKGSGKKDSSQRLRIKETGYQNEPDAYLLPFIQDFVRSGNWARVADLQNTGLITPDRVLSSETRRRLEAQGVQIPKYMTEQEAKELSKQAIRASDIPTLDQSAGGMKRGGSVHISDNPDTMRLELQVGGAVKAAKAAAKQAAKAAEKEALAVPYDIPRAPPKTKEEIRAVAERMAKQMTDEFVRPDPKKSVNVAGKTFEQFKREKGFEKDYVTRPTKDVTPPEVADIEKQKGVVKFGIPGDTTIANRELLQAGPYRLEDPSPQHGGPMFPLGGEGAWASNNPIAKNVQTRIGEMGRFFDAPVLGQYMSMGPAGSMFAQHLADANLQAIDLKSMGDRKIEQFNKLLRRGNEKTGPRESFPGIQDKAEAYLYFAFDPKLRIYFNELMQMPSVTQALKLPDGRVILDAITEPELRNKEIMTSGLSQFQFDPNIKPEDIPLSMHPTYTHLIPMKEGAPVTRTRYPTPAELEFSDVANFIRQNYPAKEFTRVMQTGSPRQKIDQQAIDEIKMYEEMMKSLTGKKEGGAVEMASGGGVGEERDWRSKIAGGGIRGIITRGLLGMDPPEDMTPREREIYENMVRLSAPAQGLGAGKAIFIGATAKTWNKAAAARAVELEKAGVSPEQIWRETGTFRGADGKLRQEISDVGAVHRNPKELQELGKAKKEEARELQLRLVGTPGQKDLFPKALTEAKRPVREQVKQLKEEAFKLMLPSDTRGQSARFALEHPELYKAYPELADIPVYQGVYGSGRELGSLRGAAGDLEMSVTQSGLRRDPKSTMLHEMQHAVQSLEDMAPGGNAAMAFQDPKAFEILKQIRQKASEPMTYDKYLETLIEANPGKKLSDINPDVARQGYESYLRSIPESVKKFDRDFQVQAANEYYKRLAGEAEARATQYREGMGPTQRRQEFPYSSYDVLPDDLIVKPPRSGLTGAAESASEIPADIAARMAAQRAELMLRSRAMQELKDQFENLPQPPKGFLSSESILQRMDEIRRREATPSGEQIPLLKKGGVVEMQAGGALKAASKAAEKAAAQTASRQAAEQTVKSIYPQADALERARQNAVKMLGLPENNTAMDRARAMGYLDDTYHGTFGRFDDFDLLKANPRSQYMPGVFTADDPRLAENFGDYIMPLLQRKGTTVLDKRDARNAGLPLPKVDTIHDKDAGIRVTNRLENIRSRFAAFDPAEMDKPGLLKKNGGAAHKPAKKVAITDNLDTMRLAVQKRK